MLLEIAANFSHVCRGLKNLDSPVRIFEARRAPYHRDLSFMSLSRGAVWSPITRKPQASVSVNSGEDRSTVSTPTTSSSSRMGIESRQFDSDLRAYT